MGSEASLAHQGHRLHISRASGTLDGSSSQGRMGEADGHARACSTMICGMLIACNFLGCCTQPAKVARGP